jgi:hypothetical protein
MAAAGLLLVVFLEERPLQQQADEPSSERISNRRSTHVHA